MTTDRDQEERWPPGSTGHPSEGTLSFYYARKLSLEEEERVREHLIECQRCRELLLEYAEFMEEGDEEREEGIADFGAAAEWRRLQEKMREGQRDTVVSDPTAIPARGGLHSLRAVYSLAAILAAGIVGLSLYTWTLQRRLTAPEVTTPQVFIPLTVRGQEGVVELVPGEEKEIPFTLEAPEASYKQYELKILDAQEQEVLSWEHVRRVGSEFNFTLDSRLFKPGAYEFKIFGLGTGNPVFLAEYPFRFIRRPAPGSGASEGSSASR